MSLNDAVPVATAKRLADLQVSDLEVLVKALSLGFSPADLHAGLVRVADSENVNLPATLGAPRQLKINAWSFVNDHGQYADTYGLSDSEAGRLKGLLRDNTDTGISEIQSIVANSLAKRGSNRPVHVSRQGMPGTSRTDPRSQQGAQGSTDLKAEISQNPTLYGMYDFFAEDTGRPGPHRFSVQLGGGLYALHQSKKGAIDVARICRVNGRDYGPIAGRVAFWRSGKAPLFGSDIPDKADFTGILKPGEEAPADPVSKADTQAAA